MDYDVRDFETEVIQRSSVIPVLVDFWAEWCGPCKMLSPVLEKLADKNKDVWELKKLNTEEFPDVAARYEIRSIPNVKMFSRGSVIDEFVGALPESRIEQWLAKTLPDKYASQLDQAESRIRQQQFDGAKALLEPIIKATPNNQRARALLALSMVFTDRSFAVQLVSNLDEASKFADIAETVRSIDLLISHLSHPDTLPESKVKSKYLEAIRNLSERRFDDAIEGFIQVIRMDRYYDDDGSRRACIAIFRLLGEEDEITMKYRREFGNALYV